MTALVPVVPARGEVTDPRDPRWGGVITLPVSAGETAVTVASVGAPAAVALAGFAATGGPVGLIGGGLAGMAAVLVSHGVGRALHARRGSVFPSRSALVPAPGAVPVTVEVLAVSEPWPGVYVESATRY